LQDYTGSQEKRPLENHPPLRDVPFAMLSAFHDNLFIVEVTLSISLLTVLRPYKYDIKIKVPLIYLI
jgi:hypothetical protein